MKLFITLALFTLFMSGCSKEEMQRAAVIDAMTTGFWKVVNYDSGSNDMTAGFTPYKFKFNTNFTVNAINGSTTEASGTWSANTNDKTITSQFNNGNATLVLLNGTWNITNNSWDFVEASQTINGTVHTLRLEKL